MICKKNWINISNFCKKYLGYQMYPNFFGGRRETRTLTLLRATDFESVLSTSSNIRPFPSLINVFEVIMF